jgi:hypothetical protein
MEKLTSKSVSFDPQGAEETAEPTPSRHSRTIDNRSLSRDDGEETPARPLVRRQPTSERYPETKVIREGPIFNGSERRPPNAESSARGIVTSSDTGEPRSSQPSPAFARSQIKPRIEVRPELLPLKRDPIQPQPTIHVTIGRLEVRAVQSSQPVAKPRRPVMNLDDYLQRRNQGYAR